MAAPLSLQRHRIMLAEFISTRFSKRPADVRFGSSPDILHRSMDVCSTHESERRSARP